MKVEPDLRSPEMKIRQLQAEIRNLKLVLNTEAPVTQEAGSDDRQSNLDANVIKKRRLHTAKNLQACLSSAAEILSSASTITAEEKLSLVEGID